MRKLGLIGGTGPESTIEYYKGIEYGVQKESGRNFFPNLTIESLSVFDVLGFCAEEDYDGLTEYLLKGIGNLAGAGAEFAARVPQNCRAHHPRGGCAGRGARLHRAPPHL